MFTIMGYGKEIWLTDIKVCRNYDNYYNYLM